MHIDIKNIQEGAWLMVNGQYAQFAHAGEDGETAYIQYYGAENIIAVPRGTLRPVFINLDVVTKCGFRKEGWVYTDGFFEITVGGKDRLYLITGRRLQKPSATHLLSKLHVFQATYLTETGRQLLFKP